jgi:hypothetical protein
MSLAFDVRNASETRRASLPRPTAELLPDLQELIDGHWGCGYAARTSINDRPNGVAALSLRQH